MIYTRYIYTVLIEFGKHKKVSRGQAHKIIKSIYTRQMLKALWGEPECVF